MLPIRLIIFNAAINNQQHRYMTLTGVRSANLRCDLRYLMCKQPIRSARKKFSTSTYLPVNLE